MVAIPASMQTVLLLAASNVFMAFGLYGHLKNLAGVWVGLCMVCAVYFIFRS